jgi:hypothetical protein
VLGLVQRLVDIDARDMGTDPLGNGPHLVRPNDARDDAMRQLLEIYLLSL